MSSPAFKKAVEDSRKLTTKPGNDDLLQLYALYKQALQDPSFDKAPAPGMFDLKGKAKHKAWQKVSDEGITAASAEKKYVELVEELKKKYGYDANKQPEAVGQS